MQGQNSNGQMRNLSRRFNHDLDFNMKVKRGFFCFEKIMYIHVQVHLSHYNVGTLYLEAERLFKKKKKYLECFFKFSHFGKTEAQIIYILK